MLPSLDILLKDYDVIDIGNRDDEFSEDPFQSRNRSNPV
jgi:hypothetical protein